MQTIPQCDPRANYLARKEEIDQAINRVLNGGRYILGSELSAFENEFANYIGVAQAIGVASGTDALHLSLRASGIVPGDLVMTVSNTAVATVAAIELAGATPVFIDIDSDGFTLDPVEFEATLRRLPLDRVKAVIPVHLYGQPANLSAIQAIADAYGLKVIEDCAQSHGATIDGIRTGSFGALAAFSFYPTKNLGAIGDGGLIVTNNPELGERVRLLREYGWKERYVSYSFGTNSRLDELQAAILRIKLKYLDRDNQRRQAIADRYREALSESSLRLPRASSGATHVYHQFVIQTEERDGLKEYLASEGVGTLIHYPVPIHQQPAYAHKLPFARPLSRTEEFASQILSLPIYPELTDAQVDQVCEHIRAWDRR